MLRRAVIVLATLGSLWVTWALILVLFASAVPIGVIVALIASIFILRLAVRASAPGPSVAPPASSGARCDLRSPADAKENAGSHKPD
jgi:hypothetical protein